MECSRCALQPVIHAFTKSNLEESFGRMKTKQIIAAVENLKREFKGICEKCHNLPSQTNELVEGLKSAWNENFHVLAESINKDTADMMPAIKQLQTAFQAVCLTCSRVSNDDNPSNHGQTFVSLDSGNCQADSGRAKTTHTDDNIVQSRADWIGLHRSQDSDGPSYGASPIDQLEEAENPPDEKTISSTLLPPEVEDRLRQEFSNFVSLDIIDKLLLSCIMSGMNVAEFAKMLWFPYSLVDPKTRRVKSITKQAAHARWMNIIKRFPIFMSVAISSTKDSKKAQERLAKFLNDPNADKQDNRFRNGRLSPYFAKAAARAKELEKQKAEHERLRKEKAKKEKERERQLQKKAKRKIASAFPDKGTVLPGLEALC